MIAQQIQTKKPRLSNHPNTQAGYSLYLKNMKGKGRLSFKDYKNIAEGYHKFISNKIIEGYSCTLPERLGVVEISGRKPKITEVNGVTRGLAPNWVETHKLWNSDPEAKKKNRRIYFLNEETGGIRYKCRWIKSRVLTKNKSLYSLIISKANKLKISALIKGGKGYKLAKEFKAKARKSNYPSKPKR